MLVRHYCTFMYAGACICAHLLQVYMAITIAIEPLRICNVFVLMSFLRATGELDILEEAGLCNTLAGSIFCAYKSQAQPPPAIS